MGMDIRLVIGTPFGFGAAAPYHGLRVAYASADSGLLQDLFAYSYGTLSSTDKAKASVRYVSDLSGLRIIARLHASTSRRMDEHSSSRAVLAVSPAVRGRRAPAADVLRSAARVGAAAAEILCVQELHLQVRQAPRFLMIL